jgi:hypothetical protein
MLADLNYPNTRQFALRNFYEASVHALHMLHAGFHKMHAKQLLGIFASPLSSLANWHT